MYSLITYVCTCTRTCSQGDVLDSALVQLGSNTAVSQQSNDGLAREVEEMKEEVTALKTQLQTLNAIRAKLT